MSGASSVVGVADAIAAVVARGGHGVHLMFGESTATAGVVALPGSVAVAVTHWVNQPTAAGELVAVLAQGGTTVAFGLD